MCHRGCAKGSRRFDTFSVDRSIPCEIGDSDTGIPVAQRIPMATRVAGPARLTSLLGVLLALGCGGEGDRDPSPPATPDETESSAGTSVAGGTGGTSAAGRGGGASDSNSAGSSSAGKPSGGSSGAAAGTAGTGSVGDVTQAPGAGLDCSSTAGSPPCAAGLLATRPCNSGQRASACVCMSPCHSAADCGGASCINIALASGASGSVCPPPSYTCGVP